MTSFVTVDNCHAFSIFVVAVQSATRAAPGGPVDSTLVSVFIDAANYSEQQLAAETSAYEALNRSTSNDMMNLGDILDEASKKE